MVVIRTGRGEIRAFHNTCRHRGSILCTDAEGRLPGDYIVCPYHQSSLTRLVPLFARRIVSPMDVPDWKEHAGSDDPRYRGGLRAGAQTWSTDGNAQIAQIESLTREDLDRGWLGVR